MIPVETPQGRSFKGAAAYYLHDKRVGGEGGLTSERVAWTETLNLPTEDAERGWRMMADTAMSQAELKAAAGVKATGRKLTKPVYAYSLSWSPGQTPTREQQLQAARETLTTLGLDAHQAIVVSHNDSPHPHIHVLVNRVNPETGVAATLGNSKLKLSEWALAYSKADGTDHLTPAREENHKRRLEGEAVEASRKPREAYEAERGSANDNLSWEFVKTDQGQKDAHLNATGRTMHVSHRRQWAELKRAHDAVKTKLEDSLGLAKERATQTVKDQAKGRWRELFRRQKTDLYAFQRSERRTLSRLWNTMVLYGALRDQEPKAGRFRIFLTLVSSSQRRAVFERRQEADRRTLSRDINAEIRAEHSKVGLGAKRDFAKLRDQYLAQCDQLRHTQAQQQAVMRQAWQVRNEERRQAYALLKNRVRAGRQDPRETTAADAARRTDTAQPVQAAREGMGGEFATASEKNSASSRVDRAEAIKARKASPVREQKTRDKGYDR